VLTAVNSRKVSSGLLVFCLLFCQESSQGDNIRVDVFGANSTALVVIRVSMAIAVSVTCSHDDVVKIENICRVDI
jgi:hypothetical protein